jgi:hypothetical protein
MNFSYRSITSLACLGIVISKLVIATYSKFDFSFSFYSVKPFYFDRKMQYNYRNDR